ncbi:hypothetical protein DFJ74DRAFT_773421 [Hyaloraphidium curvatum]|nr:hypothetical protein DFJ74DRAFT_773421 [Hyaloraphidium curvatum]
MRSGVWRRLAAAAAALLALSGGASAAAVPAIAAPAAADGAPERAMGVPVAHEGPSRARMLAARQLVQHTVLRPRPKRTTTKRRKTTARRKITTKRIVRTTQPPAPPPPPPPPPPAPPGTGAVLQPPPAAVRAPSNQWSVSLGPYGLVPNIVDRQWSNFYHVTPDCFVPVIPHSSGNGWIQFWSESSNYRTRSYRSPFFEDTALLEPSRYVYGGAYNGQGYDNGGKWLMSITRHPTKGGANLVGFFHAQDNYGDPLNGGAAAWKSIGVAYSADDGVTWTTGGVIVTSSKPRPPNWNAQFGGNGDFGAVWDYFNNRWVMLYAGDYWLGMAVSSDPDGRPGTWYKYAGPRRGFVNPGLGGESFAVGGQQNGDGSFNWNDIRGLAIRAGSNPGIHFNVYLNKWVAIWQSWQDNSLWISGNPNISDPNGWESPRFLTGSADGAGGRAWHATVVCDGGGSAWCPGNTGRIYYADRWRAPDRRDFVSRTISFSRSD